MSLVRAMASTFGHVVEAPTRRRLFFQHNENTFADSGLPVYLCNDPVDYRAGIILYPYQWIQLDKEDDCDKDWYIFYPSGVGGAYNDITVVEEFDDEPVITGGLGIPQPVLPARSGLWM